MTLGRLCAACGLGLAALALSAGPAAADAVPVPDPAVPGDAPPAPVDPFAVIADQTQNNPFGVMSQILASGPGGSPEALLSQGIGLSAPPPENPLAHAGSMLATNFRMPTGDEGSPYVLQTNPTPGPFARVDAFKGVHALGHAGLGRVPGSELGNPVPGTAPPPGTNLPPGLEQFYVPPGAAVPPVAPAPTDPVLPIPGAPAN